MSLFQGPKKQKAVPMTLGNFLGDQSTSKAVEESLENAYEICADHVKMQSWDHGPTKWRMRQCHVRELVRCVEIA